MADSEWCFFCSPDVDESKKESARKRGGRHSRKISPWAVPSEFIAWVKDNGITDHNDLRKLTDSALLWLLSGIISPAQHRAVLESAREARERIRLTLAYDLGQQIKASKPGAQLSQADELDSLWVQLETNLNSESK
jgi:hypothetical protein